MHVKQRFSESEINVATFNNLCRKNAIYRISLARFGPGLAGHFRAWSALCGAGTMHESLLPKHKIVCYICKQ